MQFTVVGLFKNDNQADEARDKLISENFDSQDIDISSYRSEGDLEIGSDEKYEEDEDTGGFWSWIFGDDDDTKSSYSKAGARNTVVTVYTHTREEAERVADIMDDNGAIEVDDDSMYADDAAMDMGNNAMDMDASSTYMDDTVNDDTTVGANTTSLGMDDDSLNSASPTTGNMAADAEGKTIDVVKEELAVGKREVDEGGIKVRTRIIEKPVQEDIRLRHERVYINRNPVDKVVDANDAFKEQSIEMTEHSEEAVVEKTARVVEEISVGKEVDEETETISETVRETEVDVENTLKDGAKTARKKKGESTMGDQSY